MGWRHALGIISACVGLCVANAACTTVNFLAQAAQGQWHLGQDARPIPEVLRDAQVSSREQALLREVLRIKAFGAARGLNVHKNYEKYVSLERQYVVWFVNASPALELKAVSFGFPIVGSFPGLSWFDERDAGLFAEELRGRGFDVNVRGVTAFSTGGWFSDPIVSSMFIDSPAQVGLLVNTLLHESLHATVLVKDEQYFNESLAAFVGDTLAPEYLLQFYGPNSREFFEYLRAIDSRTRRTATVHSAIENLVQVYDSELPDAEKQRYKTTLLEWVQRRLQLEDTPNNATLVGFQLYQEGGAAFPQLLAQCGFDWPKFLAAFDGLSHHHFGARQSADVAPVLDRIAARQCEPLPQPVLQGTLSPALRRHGLTRRHAP